MSLATTWGWKKSIWRSAGCENGELAFIYLAGFVVLLIGGPGRLSLDARLGGKAAAKA